MRRDNRIWRHQPLWRFDGRFRSYQTKSVHFRGSKVHLSIERARSYRQQGQGAENKGNSKSRMDFRLLFKSSKQNRQELTRMMSPRCPRGKKMSMSNQEVNLWCRLWRQGRRPGGAIFFKPGLSLHHRSSMHAEDANLISVLVNFHAEHGICIARYARSSQYRRLNKSQRSAA